MIDHIAVAKLERAGHRRSLWFVLLPQGSLAVNPPQFFSDRPLGVVRRLVVKVVGLTFFLVEALEVDAVELLSERRFRCHGVFWIL